MKNALLFVVLIVSFIGCLNQQNSEFSSRQGGKVIIAHNAVVEDIFPITTDEVISDQIHRFMLSPSFVQFNESGDAQPDLAEAWHIDDNNASVTFIINPEMKWSSGEPVTTKDIKFTYELIKSGIFKTPMTDRINLIKNLEINDSLSCRFDFQTPVSDPLYFTHFSILPAELDSFRTRPAALKRQYIKNFNGCGPFIITSINKDSLVLSRNDYYPDIYPYLDKIILKTVEDNKQLSIMLEEGKIDLSTNLPLELAVKKEYLKQYEILTYPERGYTMICWNLNNPLFSNIQMRQALTYAIDRQTLVDGILGGYSEIVNGPVYLNDNEGISHLPEWPFDPARAESILNSLGWTLLKSEGIRQKYKKDLTFTLMVNKENKERIDCAVNIRANLGAVGVRVKLELLDWQQVLQNIHNKEFDAVMLTWTDGDHYDPSELFHSSAISTGLNFMSYSSKVTDSFIDGALQAWDKKQKKYYWKQFQSQVADDLPCTFLFSQKILIGYHKNLRNVITDNRGYLINVKEWWLDSGIKKSEETRDAKETQKSSGS